jgi:hypothetical protein
VPHAMAISQPTPRCDWFATSLLQKCNETCDADHIDSPGTSLRFLPGRETLLMPDGTGVSFDQASRATGRRGVKDLMCGVRARRMDGRAPARGCASFKNAVMSQLRCHWGGGSRGLGDDQLMRLGGIVPWRPQTTACSPSASVISCEVSRPVHARRRSVVPKRNAFSSSLRSPTN